MKEKTLEALERGLKKGLIRWERARTCRGKLAASQLVEDAILNMDVMLGRPQHFRTMLQRGDVDINLVERWLKARRKTC